jgi:G3E family GTPase
MEIKDKRFVEQMDLMEQEKYLKNLKDILVDANEKLEVCEISYRPIQLQKRLKKALHEGQKEKASAPDQEESIAKEPPK